MTVFKRKDRKEKPWVFRYKYIDSKGNKKTKNESFATKALAKKAEAKYIVDHGGAAKIDPSITVADYYDDWVKTFKSKSVSANTMSKYATSGVNIRKYFGNTKMVELTRTLYQQFINWYIDDDYGHQHSKQSVEKLHSHAHQAIQEAAIEGLITQDVALKPQLGGKDGKPSSTKFLDEDQFEALRDYANKFADPSRIGLMMTQFAIYTGARIGEIGGMTWDDIDEENKTITINKTYQYATFKPERDKDNRVKWPDNRKKVFGPTKTAASVRTIAVSPTLINSLHTLILAQKIKVKDNPYHLLFLGPDGVPPASNDANKEMRRAMKHLKIEKDKFTFHGLRHSHGSYLLSKGVDLKYVSVRLGHENIGITIKIYTHVLDRFKKEEEIKAVQVL